MSIPNSPEASSPENATRKPFIGRDKRIIYRKIRQDMVDSIDLWTNECSWVSLEGETASDRAWECFRDWIREQKAAGRSDAVGAVLIYEEEFHSVMANLLPAPGIAGGYRLTVAAKFRAKKIGPAKTISKRKPNPSRKR